MIRGVKKITNFEALVVILKDITDVITEPGSFLEHVELFKNMTIFVDGIYTSNTSRAFIGRGLQGGIALQTLLNEDPKTNIFDNYIATDSPSFFNGVVKDINRKNSVPKDMLNKKLHFSFTSTNNRINCLSMITSFEDANYPWLTFKSVEYPNGTHENNYPVSFADGLKFIYEQ